MYYWIYNAVIRWEELETSMSFEANHKWLSLRSVLLPGLYRELQSGPRGSLQIHPGCLQDGPDQRGGEDLQREQLLWPRACQELPQGKAAGTFGVMKHWHPAALLLFNTVLSLPLVTLSHTYTISFCFWSTVLLWYDFFPTISSRLNQKGFFWILEFPFPVSLHSLHILLKVPT